jgi:hypothetical protein
MPEYSTFTRKILRKEGEVSPSLQTCSIGRGVLRGKTPERIARASGRSKSSATPLCGGKIVPKAAAFGMEDAAGAAAGSSGAPATPPAITPCLPAFCRQKPSPV